MDGGGNCMKKISILAGFFLLIFSISTIGSVAATTYAPLLSISPGGNVWTINFDTVDITADDIDVTTLVAICFISGDEIQVTPIKVLTRGDDLVLIFKPRDFPTEEIFSTLVTADSLDGFDDISAAGPPFAWGRR
jgi:hypothetical protein